MKFLQEYIAWAREQMFKTNPPKQQHDEHIVHVEAKKTRKPRAKKTGEKQ